MTEPQKIDVSSYANLANELSISFAPLMPQTGSDVADFLYEAAFALGLREADLARTLGVSRATLSGWKTRGAIPPLHLQWFGREFAYAVLIAPPTPQFDLRHAGIRLALRLIQTTDFNPFRLKSLRREDATEVCFLYLGGLARLGLFLQHRLGRDDLSDVEARAVALLGDLALLVAHRLVAEHRVSQ